MLTTEERDNLVKYKLERARETWNEIVGIVEGGYWYAAANRILCLLLCNKCFVGKEWNSGKYA